MYSLPESRIILECSSNLFKSYIWTVRDICFCELPGQLITLAFVYAFLFMSKCGLIQIQSLNPFCSPHWQFAHQKMNPKFVGALALLRKMHQKSLCAPLLAFLSLIIFNKEIDEIITKGRLIYIIKVLINIVPNQSCKTLLIGSIVAENNDLNAAFPFSSLKIPFNIAFSYSNSWFLF